MFTEPNEWKELLNNEGKKWLSQIEDNYTDSHKLKRSGEHPLFQLVDQMSGILGRIQVDFEETSRGNATVIFGPHHINKGLETDIYPPNNNKLTEKDLQKVNQIIGQSIEAIRFPKKLSSNIDFYKGEHTAKQIMTDVNNALLGAIDDVYKNIIYSIAENKTLDLDQDYPGRDVLLRFRHEIDRVREKTERDIVQSKIKS